MDFRGKNIDLVGKQNLWFGISLAVIIIPLIFGVFCKIQGKPFLNLGIDFKGGAQLQYLIPRANRPAAGQEPALVREVSQAIEAKGLRGVRVQIVGGDTMAVSTDARDDAELNSQDRVVNGVLRDLFKLKPDDKMTFLSRQLVGPVIGDELRANAVKGVVLGVLLIALWIYIRYNFAGDGMRYAVAGIAALVHDVLVLIGVFAVIGHLFPKIEMDGTFIAALLTVVGYSINDSVVIFDRIRENLRLRRREPFNKVVNDSLLETMSRSINTGLTVLIMLLMLLLFGGESIFNFILAMLIGIASGLYSSIFNASMVLTAWHSHDEKKAAAARATRAPGRAAPGRTVTVRDVTPRAAVATPRATALPTTPGDGTPAGAATPAPSAAPASPAPVTPATAVTPTEVTASGAGASGVGARPPRKARAKRRF